MNANEDELSKVIRMLDIRIKLDEYEDSIIAQLAEIRTSIRAGEMALADEQVTALLDTMTEDIEDE